MLVVSEMQDLKKMSKTNTFMNISNDLGTLVKLRKNKQKYLYF